MGCKRSHPLSLRHRECTMKQCSYCGRDNDESATNCCECGVRFAQDSSPAVRNWISFSLFPRSPDAWMRLWLRCLIFVCLLLLGVEFWSSDQDFIIRSYTQGIPRAVGGFCGLVLFASSSAFFGRVRVLACLGLVVSIPAMLVALLPTVAYN